MGSLLKDTPHLQVNPHAPPALFPSHRQGSVLTHLLSPPTCRPRTLPMSGIARYVASRFQGPSDSQRGSARPPLHCGAILHCAGRPPFISTCTSGRALGLAGCNEQRSREHSQQASARSHSNARLNPLLKCQAVGQSCWTSWTGPQQDTRFQIPPHPC